MSIVRSVVHHFGRRGRVAPVRYEGVSMTRNPRAFLTNDPSTHKRYRIMWPGSTTWDTVNRSMIKMFDTSDVLQAEAVERLGVHGWQDMTTGEVIALTAEQEMLL